MTRPFPEDEPRTVAELLKKYGTSLIVSKTPDRVVVQINLPLADLPSEIPCPPLKAEIESSPSEWGLKLPPDYEDCKGSMRLRVGTSIHDFPGRGVAVRFNNTQTYFCGTCGQESGTEDRTQDTIIGRTLHMMREQFTLQKIGMIPPSLNRVRKAILS